MERGSHAGGSLSLHGCGWSWFKTNPWCIWYWNTAKAVQKSRAESPKEEDKDFLCLFYSGALGALIINWIELGMHDDIDTLVNKVKILLDGNINNYINMTKCGKCQR